MTQTLAHHLVDAINTRWRIYTRNTGADKKIMIIFQTKRKERILQMATRRNCNTLLNSHHHTRAPPETRLFTNPFKFARTRQTHHTLLSCSFCRTYAARACHRYTTTTATRTSLTFHSHRTKSTVKSQQITELPANFKFVGSQTSFPWTSETF